MGEISAAIDESLLDQFILKTNKTNDNRAIGFGSDPRYFEGKIHGKNLERIFIKIPSESFLSVYQTESFDLRFILNRVPFQMQHFALDILRDQHLFDLLIDNPAYDDVDGALTSTKDSEMSSKMVSGTQKPEFLIG